MIEARPTHAGLAAFGAQVAVIGAGPVGIATALALARRGVPTLLLESGGTAPRPEAQALSDHATVTPATHHPPAITVARRLGGAGNLWGGRCLPFDPIDFGPRPWLGLGPWPIGPAELDPWLGPACAALGAGEPVFAAPLAGVAADPAFGVGSLERWSIEPRPQRLHRRALAESRALRVALGATVTGFDYAPSGRIEALRLHLEGEGAGRLPVPEVVLAAGGNESTRLLLAEERRSPGRFGGAEGPLGRFYMGHLNGQVADIVLEDRALHDGLDFFVDGHGSYVRRRIVPSPATQAEARLTNIAFWPVVPPVADPAHRSGPLSAVFLGLSVAPLARRLVAEPIRLKHLGPPPHRRGPHLANLLRDLPRTAGFVPAFLWRNRVARMRLPGFFLTNPARRYGLEYHAEHLPRAASRLVLGDRVDRLGLPYLEIALVFGEEDAAAVLRAHAALEAWLARNRLGRILWRVPPGDRAAAVLAEARHGNHQIGTIRMGEGPRDGVVDRDCRAFFVPNLAVVSTAVLPTSGQANPTLLATQLGLRLASRIADRLARAAGRG